ncbi:uncharacterized protein LOC128955962 [Oppia nitens]|uniref:uncharacterized protein LOC128955962 n=1 Tax=Oppia nitens TaxID=1686743 RepID=UPI0023DAFC18|nr:uncharacterized protein LOC128955962 [Oppia nitens]
MPYFYVHSVRERLCTAGRLPQIYCNHTLLTRAVHTRNDLSEQQLADMFIQQKIDAIIYIIIVLIFYGVIISIVLVTNCHRFRDERFDLKIPRRKDLMVRSDSSLKILDPIRDSVPNYSAINVETDV